MLSAKSTVVKSTKTKEKTETKQKTKGVKEYGCAPVSYSCGVKGYACGNNALEIAINAWEGEGLFCG